MGVGPSSEESSPPVVETRSPAPAPGPSPSRAAIAAQMLHEGIKTITEAVEADTRGDFNRAFQLYTSGLGTIVPALKDVPPAVRAQYSTGIAQYMTRAEELKSLMTLPTVQPGVARATSDGHMPQNRATLGGGGSGGSRPLGAPGAAVAAAPPEREVLEFEDEILREVMDSTTGVSWDSIAGLEFAKEQLQEAVIRPMLRPDLYSGLRAPPKGVLLFGPPGTGKTMLAKAVAQESRATFFSMSASSLMSKWVGEGEKRVRALFSAAVRRQPSVIFIDEVDSMLGRRSEGENDAARRLKTEFMVQLDGATTAKDTHVFVLAATNRPWEIDDAILRRLSKKIYIPLPDIETRKQLVLLLMKGQPTNIPRPTLVRLAEATEGYSCSDLTELVREAARVGVRGLTTKQLLETSAADVPPISTEHFKSAMKVIRPSVSPDSLAAYAKWNAAQGSR